jgi:DNA-binding XRE family transcriptional regulator
MPEVRLPQTRGRGDAREGEIMTQQLSPDLLGSVVKRYREQDLQLSQADLAWLAGVSRGTISNLETGRVNPDERTWHRIRTALALPQTALRADGTDGAARPIMPEDAVQGIITAILAIRDRNPEVGRSAADRWRRLVGKLTFDDGQGWPEANAEIAWLARDVARMAPPGKIQSIHDALRNWGWAAGDQISIAAPTQPTQPPQAESESLHQMREQFSALTSSVNDMAAQIRTYREETQGFGRLPPRVQDLLAKGLVVDYEINNLETVPGVSTVSIIIINEEGSPPTQRNDIRRATHRWTTILKIAVYIVEHLAPNREPREIINAIEYGLRAQASTEVDKLRQQARGGQTVAMYSLGKLLRRSGRPDEAEVWLRRAADVGHPGAQFNLGKLVEESGRPDEAEGWLRRAADADHPDAPFSLWKLNIENGRPREAEVWLRRAADAGHRDAMFSLWKLKQENGGAGEAEVWLRRAADAGHPRAQFILGNLVRESGKSQEAVDLLRRAAEAGDSGAMSTVEIMLYERRLQMGSVSRMAE